MPSPSLFRDPSYEHLQEQEVQHLLQIGAIEHIPHQHRGKCFCSHYFLTQKNIGGWRPRLNKFVKVQKVRMVTLSAIILMLEQRDWFAAFKTYTFTLLSIWHTEDS